MRDGEVLGLFSVSHRVTREKVCCCFCGADPGGLRKELAVLCVEQSAEGGEIACGDSVKERVVVHRHCA